MEHDDRTNDIADTIPNWRRRILNRNFVTVFCDENRILSERYDSTVLQATHDRVLYGRTCMLVNDGHYFGNRSAARIAHIPTRKILCYRIDVIDISLCIGCDDTVTNRL